MEDTSWFGHRQINFTVGGRESFIVCPENPLPGNPWVWRTEFFSAFDTVDRALLMKGWHLAYHRVSDMYGNPESVEMLKAFYDTATSEYGMSRLPAIFGFSRGGLYAVNFAARYPHACGILYLDAPVCDIRSWPGKNRACREWLQCLDCYGLTQESAEAFSGNPKDYAGKNASDGIPVIIVAGDSDTVVPYSENGAVYAESYRKKGSLIETIVKPGCDHHPHSLADPEPVVRFIEDQAMKLGILKK